MRHLPMILGAIFAIGITPSTGWCSWNPRKSIEEAISGEKPLDQQIRKQSEQVRPEYRTNKFELKAQQEAGGWILAWSADISETDVAQGVVAAGISIYSGGSSFALWVENLVDRTITSTMNSAKTKFPGYIRTQAANLAQQVIFNAIKGKSAQNAFKNFDTVDFKAGAIRYTGGNYLGDQLIGPHTWGMKIYLGFRIRASQERTFYYPTVKGYSLDACREWANNCGLPAATAFCQSQGYSRAIDFKRTQYYPTIVISSGQICNASYCTRLTDVVCK